MLLVSSTTSATENKCFLSTGLKPGLSINVICLAVFILFLNGCQTGSFNNTAYPFIINEEKIASKKVNTLIVAHVNFGSPSKKYLQAHTQRVDAEVIDRLTAAGYQVQDNQYFRKAWREAVRKYGEPYNPSTSQINPAAFKRVISSTLNALKTESSVDAVVFTDLIERQVTFGSNLNRNAKWDGVTRKPRLKGSATGVSQGFDWTQNVPAASLSVTIYHVSGEHLFQSIGGMEVTRQIDPNTGNGRFIRREKILKSSSHIKEGVNLALHPFVKMKNYPENN